MQKKTNRSYLHHGDKMNIEKEISTYNVSRETQEKLRDFVLLLQEWNEKMNLVSKSSMADVWVRHVLDSMQLIKYIKKDVRSVVDIGSGSGFPGIVTAILLQETAPTAKIFFVESIAKKTVYLKDVCEKLGLNNVMVVHKRIEDAVFKDVDVVTARAVAALNVLLGYAYKISSANTKMIFPKGQSYLEEINEAKKQWVFKCDIHKNMYHENGVVLEISKVEKKK